MTSCVFEKIYDFGKNCGNFYRVLPISRAYFFRGDYLFSRLTNFEGASQLRGPLVYMYIYIERERESLIAIYSYIIAIQ